MILTPDQRLRVFVSSASEELEVERDAAIRAIGSLHFVPVTLGVAARAHQQRVLRRAYIEQSQVFVGIYGRECGTCVAGGTMPILLDEFRIAAGMPRLVYVKSPVPTRDAELTEFIDAIIDDGSISFRQFVDADELAELVADDLAVLLTERFEGHRRGGPSPDADSAARSLTNLPAPPSSLVGREHDVEHVGGMLQRDDVRLVTLTGVGGIGKSRLAFEVGRTLCEEFPDGVHVVRLDTVPDASMVLGSIAASLRVRSEGDRSELETLVNAIGELRMLLVLDNFEHVIGAAAEIAALLERCPRLKVLVTSRRVLRLLAEREFRVPPLQVPGRRARGRTASEALFETRAQAVRPDFEVTDAQAGAVREIVRRLDGIPLAIELAAARMRILSPEALLDRLASSLDMSAAFADLPERQRTLRATIDWSHSLLSGPERILFARLGTFSGGCNLDAVEAVCGHDMDVLDALASLAEHSLVVIEPGADPSREARFRTLEPVRQYARDRLAESGEADEVDARHREYFVALAHDAAQGLQGRDQETWLVRLEADIGNLRVLGKRALEAGDAALVGDLAMSMWVWLWLNNHLDETGRWMHAALETGSDLHPVDRARAVWTLSGVEFERGNHERARRLLDECMPVFREAGDEEGIALGLFVEAALAPAFDDAPPMGELIVEAREHFRRLGYEFAVLVEDFSYGADLVRIGRIPEAVASLEETHAAASAFGNRRLLALADQFLGVAHLVSDGPDRARPFLTRALETHVRLDSDEGVAYGLDGFAAVALFEGDPGRAATLVGAADRLRSRAGLSVWPLAHEQRQGVVDATRDALGDAFGVAYDAGRSLPREDAVAYALEGADAGKLSDAAASSRHGGG